jgi:predicted amidohydrolase
MKIGIAQLCSVDDITTNLNLILRLMEQAAPEKPEIIFFPENALYFRIDTSTDVQALALEDLVFEKLQDKCIKLDMAIHLTTAIEDKGQVFNASVLIDRLGHMRVVYRKIHLFDISLSGQRPIRESDVFTPGVEPSISQVGDFKVGHSICYDVRFSELFLKYARAEVDLIAVPAAFLVKTGQAHWEVLLRARAIESQCYVVASAQVGKHISVHSPTLFRETYGHSMLVSPWGDVLALQKSDVGLFFYEISKDEVSRVRAQIPMKNHRRI